ncbi:MAG: 4-hydroxy-3-methylbut-2-enyl diphosphate reductase [Candidatus Bipolaricaulota bacterium]|nr:4-hydroxy-3-methylbut-2-enyl diphosphate reductase [Candidatus Bipolaricaulota bacterium]MCS7275105.1 4-hydroxy-3-methylbut-2-enyl diphosphate reductase [Candidatus Bipolaricaulota bacterium]MDW8110273.1 4-hydroxy-3-methylbut-2-enyl diphosphate reductase [Candidatus Bipolaricaulota bacterium]MDW8328826.1 4-hydroxy-3-methylbut-2-enyl diphosphate reductase [Candidatus Bipolaricaulota bacterium]
MIQVQLNKPIVEIASSAGWCFGVERIVEMAEKLLEQRAPDEPVYCLGELIHNPQEVARLRAKGMVFVKSHEELPPLEPGQRRKVLIRAHGVAPSVKKILRAKGYEIYDGTCPLVTIPHRFAREIAEQGYRLVIMGDREHPEIQGILGEVEGLNVRVDVIPGPEAIEALQLKASDRVGLISQTTHPFEKFAQLVGEVLKRALEVKAYNTICQATFDRQDAIRELAQRCDLVIVIGGRNSSNTCRLAEIASQYTVCYHIEDASELKGEWLRGKRRIGISAGASTPTRCIDEVKAAIERLTNRDVEER